MQERAALSGILFLAAVLLAVVDCSAQAAEISGTVFDWIRCASEGVHCSFSGTKEVRYGADGRYRQKVLTDGTNCTNGVFGDPISGVTKTCWYRPWSSAPVPCDSSQGSCARPATLSKWDWQLSLPYDVSRADAIRWYDLDWEDATPRTIAAIHAKGAKVACYMSVGTWEKWRRDKSFFPAFVQGKIYEEWPDERWLDVRRTDVLVPIMEARMDVCRQKGFDGVQFDNLDGFENNALAKTGFPLKRAHEVQYARWLANIAHRKGLSVAWENAIPLLPSLVSYMDWFIMEECNQYDECGAATAFTNRGKFVGAVEYSDTIELQEFKTYCDDNAALRISSIFKNRNLGRALLWSCQ